MILWVALGAVGVAFVLSVLSVPLTQRLAARFGMLDVPGRHKAHARPIPLLGGCAIFAAILVPSLLAAAVATTWNASGAPSWIADSPLADHIAGAAAKAPQAIGILAAALGLHVLGLLDDRKHLGPWLKLIVELLVCGAVVVFCNVRALTAAGAGVSITASILWLVAITNAFNFLDNMDGLAAGVAAICAAALLAASAAVGRSSSPRGCA